MAAEFREAENAMLPVSPENLPALMRQAQQHQAAGRFAQARGVLESVVASAPDLAEAHFLLAKTLLRLSEPEKAVSHLDRAVDLKPGAAVIWRQYAAVLQWLADPAKSTAFLDRAKQARIDRKLLIELQEMLRGQPKRSKTSIGGAPPGEVQKAISLLQGGRAKEAAALASRLDRAHPNVALIVDLLANAQAEQGRHQEAEANFRRAIGIDPKYPEVRANYAQFLMRRGRHDEAVEAAGDALRLMPDMPGALSALGTSLNRKAQHAQAIPFLRRTLTLSPDQVAPRLELAEALLADFKPGQALEALEQIRELDMPTARNRVLRARALAALDRSDEAEAEFDAALDAAQSKALALAGKAELLQVLGRFEEAGNLLREALDLEPLEGKLYQQLVMTRKLKPGDPLIARMEATHADPALAEDSRMYLGYALAKALEDAGEYERVFTYLRPANDAMRGFFPFDAARYRKTVRGMIEAFAPADFSEPVDDHVAFAPIFVTGLPRSGTTLVEQIIASHSQVTGGGELSHAYAALKEALAEMEKRGERCFAPTRERIAEIGRSIETRMRDAVPGAGRITDKGVSTYEVIGPICAIFPKARIVVVRRDPRDTLLSMYKNVFPEGTHRYASSLTDLATKYHGYMEFLEFWREKLPGSFHEIEYEALIADPETEARKLIAACDLDWEDQCLAFHENKRRVQTLSVHQVRQPLYATSMKAWQRYQDDLGELFDALGPEFDPRVAVEDE